MPTRKRCSELEAVRSLTAAFESVDDVHGSHRPALGVLGVCDSVKDYALKEGLENTADFVVDSARDAHDTATTSEATNGGIGDTQQVVTQDHPMAWTSTAHLTEPLTAFSVSRHFTGRKKIHYSKRPKIESCDDLPTRVQEVQLHLQPSSLN